MTKQIKKLELGTVNFISNSKCKEITSRIIDNYQDHHSYLREWELVNVLQETQDKINELIESNNNLQSRLAKMEEKK